MTVRDWLYVVTAMVGLIGTAGSTLVWAANQHYVTQESMLVKEIRDLDREITYIEIKKQTGEATQSEIIYVESLKQQKRALEQELNQ
jgi:hypothetical protein